MLLVLKSGAFTTHPLADKSRLTIGRSEENAIRIDDPSVSRRHAVLHVGAGLAIEDAGSANGTRIRAPLSAGRGGRGKETTTGAAGPTRALRKGERVAIEPGTMVELGSIVIVVQRKSVPEGRPRRLWPHGHFEACLEEECARAKRSRESFALVRVRTDAAPNPAAVQRALFDSTRSHDVVAAYGPGEFEALLIDTTAADAAAVADHMTDAFAAAGLGARVGTACYPSDGSTPEALFERAGSALRGEVDHEATLPRDLVVCEPKMRELYDLVGRVASSNIPVLIVGETGAGKEIVAESIWRRSSRASRPMLRLNCAAIAEALLESELFGHERGAFTGAVQAKPGLLEAAQGGVVLLDEVGDLPIGLQAKLLRTLEDKHVLRVGAVKPRRIDVRFIAATNRDLERDVERGTFRADLYYRLNGLTLAVPPLRERPTEIEPLARAFVLRFAREAGRSRPPDLRSEALDLLVRYRWPGNIRELRNVMERAVLLCSKGPIGPEHLPVDKMQALLSPTRPTLVPPRPPDDGSPEPSERDRIIEALARCAGNQTHAARMLGISRGTLVSRLEQYDLPRPRKAR